MAEIEPNAREMAAAKAAISALEVPPPESAQQLEDWANRIGAQRVLGGIIAQHTRPRWTDERPTAADVGCVALFKWVHDGAMSHGVIVEDEEGVLWLKLGKRTLWIHDEYLRGRWCVYPKPMEASDG